MSSYQKKNQEKSEHKAHTGLKNCDENLLTLARKRKGFGRDRYWP